MIDNCSTSAVETIMVYIMAKLQALPTTMTPNIKVKVLPSTKDGKSRRNYFWIKCKKTKKT